jgi:hypothetical protein
VGGVDASHLSCSAGVVRCGQRLLSFVMRIGRRWTAAGRGRGMHSGSQLSTELSSGVGRSVTDCIWHAAWRL